MDVVKSRQIPVRGKNFKMRALPEPNCRAEIPDLVALQEKYKDTLQVIGISEDEAGVEVVKRFAAEHKVNYPVAMTTPNPVFTASCVRK